jgi:hypothetical protein
MPPPEILDLGQMKPKSTDFKSEIFRCGQSQKLAFLEQVLTGKVLRQRLPMPKRCDARPRKDDELSQLRSSLQLKSLWHHHGNTSGADVELVGVFPTKKPDKKYQAKLNRLERI